MAQASPILPPNQVSQNKMKRTNRHPLPKPDSRGRIRPVVGLLANGQKARFTVGNDQTSPAEANRRLDLIRSLYESQCDRFHLTFWIEWTRRVAATIACGQPITDAAIGDADHLEYRAGAIEQLKDWGIPVVVNDAKAHGEGLQIHNKQIAAVVQQMVKDELARQHDVRGAVAQTATLPADPLAMAETSSFHQVLDAYSAHREKTGSRDENDNLKLRIHKSRDRVRYLKQHHDDMPLWKLQLPVIEVIASYWRNRPKTRKGNRCSVDHAREMLKEFWRFLNWLDSHPNYRWHKPRNVDRIKRYPDPLPEDESGEAFQTDSVPTYTSQQLATIASHTDDFGKALIGVCVNAAFGQSEIGQWPTSLFRLWACHPDADKIHFESSTNDSWITGKRPKTRKYGEHLLWPQVARAVEPFLDGRPVLPMTRTGARWYRTHSKNPQTAFYNWWKKLIAKVQSTDPEFIYLPFGSLRDTLPNVLRSQYSDDVASLALQHGGYTDDPLLKCYTNQPFRKLFICTRELEAYFKPLLDVISPSPR